MPIAKVTQDFVNRLADGPASRPVTRYAFRAASSGRVLTALEIPAAPCSDTVARAREPLGPAAPPLPALVRASSRVVYAPARAMSRGAAACLVCCLLVSPAFQPALGAATLCLAAAALTAWGIGRLLFYCQGDLRRAVAPHGEPHPRLLNHFASLPMPQRQQFARLLAHTAAGLPTQQWAEISDFLQWADSDAFGLPNGQQRLAELLTALGRRMGDRLPLAALRHASPNALAQIFGLRHPVPRAGPPPHRRALLDPAGLFG